MTTRFTVVEARWGDDQLSIESATLPDGGGTITVRLHTQESKTKRTPVPAPTISIGDLSISKTAESCGNDALSSYTQRCWQATFDIPANDSFDSISYDVAASYSSGQITDTRGGSVTVAALPPPSTDKPALVALYNATGGASWAVKTNWLSNDPVGEWVGVTTGVERGRVTRLDLRRNQLSGEIPAELGSLSRLEVLDLRANRLQGDIPGELSNLTILIRLELTGNELGGNIPSTLNRLTNLESLYLDDNKLTGNIPASLGLLTSLIDLDLSVNKLTGSIPPELGSMTSLESLHLDDNGLSGEIPLALASMTNLESLRLDKNQLTGCIPQGLREIENNDLASLGLPFCDVLLSGLTISPGVLTPAFTSYQIAYTAAVGPSPITVTPANAHNAAIAFLGENDALIPDADGALAGHQVDLGDGTTTIKIKVTSQDGKASLTYAIKVAKSGLPDAPAIAGPIAAGPASLTVSWTAPAETGGTDVTSYDLRHIESGAADKADANWTVVGGAWTSGPLSYTIESLTGGTQYDVQVRAVNAAGAGPWSATVTGTPATWGATRSFSPALVDAGGEVEVTIDVAGLGGLGSVVETLPDGFSYVSSGLSHSAVQVEGQEVTFTLLGSDSTFTYTVTAASVEGPHSFSGVVSNADAVAQPVGGAFIVTVAAEPGVYVNIARSTASPVRLNSPVPVTVTFSEPVFGFTIDDIDINAGNGAKGNFSGSDGDAVYTFDVTPTAIGTMTVDIAASVAKHADGNGNTEAPRLSFIPYDDDGDAGISKNEAIAAVRDYFSGNLTKEQTIAVIRL